MVTKKSAAPVDPPLNKQKRARVMPDFGTGRVGWINPDYFTGAHRERMLLALSRSPLSQHEQLGLIDFCCRYLQMTKVDEDAGATQKEQILAVAQESRRLLASMNKLGKPARSALKAHADYLMHGSTPPVTIDFAVRATARTSGQSLLSTCWLWVDALEHCCEYAASMYQVDRASKPAQTVARGAVALMAQHILQRTGKLPPSNGASWFAEFAGFVGEVVGLEIGPRIVASGINLVSSR